MFQACAVLQLFCLLCMEAFSCSWFAVAFNNCPLIFMLMRKNPKPIYRINGQNPEYCMATVLTKEGLWKDDG